MKAAYHSGKIHIFKKDFYPEKETAAFQLMLASLHVSSNYIDYIENEDLKIPQLPNLSYL